MTEMTTTIIIGLLIPLLGTVLGSAFVFFMKAEMSPRVQKSLLGFASGVMVAASVWSLLIPAMDMEAESGKWSVVPAAIGFLLGIGFLLLIDELTPHLHIGTEQPEGIRSHLSKTAMLALAVTIHNLPEGMAVGVVFAGAENGASFFSRCHFRIIGHSHTEHSRRSHYLYADACGWQQQMEIVRVGFAKRSCGTDRCHSRPVARLTPDACPPIHARFCSRRHVLCSGGRAYPRSFQRTAQQSQYHRLRYRFRIDDGA